MRGDHRASQRMSAGPRECSGPETLEAMIPAPRDTPLRNGRSAVPATAPGRPHSSPSAFWILARLVGLPRLVIAFLQLVVFDSAQGSP